MSIISTAQIISNLLQANWTLSSPLLATQISWPSTRLGAVAITETSEVNAVQVAVYNSSPARMVTPLSRECYHVAEKLTVDIIVRNAGQDSASLALAEATVDAIATEVYRIIHLQDPNYAVNDEPIHSNSPEVTREMITVIAAYFHVATGSSGVFT